MILPATGSGNLVAPARSRSTQPLSAGWASTAIVVALASLVARPAHAQRPIPGVPPGVTGDEVPPGSPLPRILPPAPPSISGGALSIPQASPSGEVPKVDVPVGRVVIEGATAYPSERLDRLTAGLTGPAVPLSKIEEVRTAILNLYRGDGYVLTAVTAALGPGSGAAASPAGGTLRFIISEGRIADIKLEGDIGPAATQVLRFLNHITEARPINTATLERWLLLAQDVPGVSVRAVLRPSDEPGALTLIAQVSRQAVNGLATVDNRGFRNTGPVEGLTVLDLNSFTSLGEKTEFSIFHTDGNTSNFGQASEEVFVGGSGLKVRLYGGYGKSAPSDYFRTLNYEGFTTVFGASAAYPVIRARTETLNLTANLDAVESESRTNSGPLGRDSLRIGRLGVDYAIEDLLLGPNRSAINTAVVRVSQGLPFLGGSGKNNPTPGRVGEDVGFAKITADLARTQNLFSPWDGASVALKGRVVGQLARGLLPPAEKFYLGGTDLGRGFYSGEVTGDSAFGYSLELQLNTDLDFTAFGTPVAVGAQWYVFYDHGETYQNHKAGVAPDPNYRLSSEGVGTRVSITRYTEFDVEGALRNTRLEAGTPGLVKPLKADAVYWRVLTRF
jgi:hemolysin activation/secretion protein